MNKPLQNLPDIYYFADCPVVSKAPIGSVCEGGRQFLIMLQPVLETTAPDEPKIRRTRAGEFVKIPCAPEALSDASA